MLDSQVFHCYEAYEPASSSLAKPYSAIWPEMPSPAAFAEFHIKTVIERRQGYQIHEKRKSSMELCCCFFHIQMSSLLSKMQPRHEWATSSFWPELLLSSSESGSWSWGCWVSDELHHASQQAGMNWLKLPTSGLEINKRKCSEIRRRCTQAVGHEQTCETRKPSMQQLESYTHKQASTVSRHGLRFPGRTTNDGGAAHVSANWPQFVQKALAAGHLLSPIAGNGQLRGIHFILLLSTPPLPSLVTSSYPSQHIALLPDKTSTLGAHKSGIYPKSIFSKGCF